MRIKLNYILFAQTIIFPVPREIVRNLPPYPSRPRGNDLTFLLEVFCIVKKVLSMGKCLLSSSDMRLESITPIRMHLPWVWQWDGVQSVLPEWRTTGLGEKDHTVGKGHSVWYRGVHDMEIQSLRTGNYFWEWPRRKGASDIL